jgi:hypothetical protein
LSNSSVLLVSQIAHFEIIVGFFLSDVKQRRIVNVNNNLSIKPLLPKSITLSCYRAYPLNISNDIGTLVQHRPQNFCSHDEAGRLRPQANITSQQTHVKLSTKISELLVADGLYGRGVYCSRALLLSCNKTHSSIYDSLNPKSYKS